MATASDLFYGCLCLETSSGPHKPLIPAEARKIASPPIPSPEIHFNIWEKGIDTEPFLDIGVMLATNDPAERIEIFLPWALEPQNIEDLSPRILAPNGVSAIFNEAWTSSGAANSPGGYVTRTNGSIFTIISYNQPKIEQRQYKQKPLYSIVLDIAQLKATSAAAAPAVSAHRTPDQMYVRIRIKGVPLDFYQVGFDQGDTLSSGAFNRTEIIDFRLNVRRGAPVGIESFLCGRFLEFSKVQLFLMKSRDQDIVFEDKLFKACRSLEDENFWAGYLLPPSAPHKVVEKSLKHVKGSLGYQWRKTPDSPNSDVTEFGMLARFKSFKMNKRTILAFIFFALFLGAAGNGIYDLCKSAFTSSDASASTSQSLDRAKSEGALISKKSESGSISQNFHKEARK